MKFGRFLAVCLAGAALMFAQPPALTPEQQELRAAISEIGSSNIDLIRVLEAHLKKYPNSPDRKDIERALVKAALETKDDRRTILYGESVLATAPDDMFLLDRVAKALLTSGGKDNAQHALTYSQRFQQIVEKMAPVEGATAARRQEDRDRGVARALLYQSRAEAALGHGEQSVKLAEKSFAVYPCEESAREWGSALMSLGRNEEAISKFADAFVIPDSRALDSDRAQDRKRLGEIYRKQHGSEQGLGDIVLAAYDRTAELTDTRQKKYAALDPNSIATDPMTFTITGLDGQKFPLKNLKGKVVVLDFWATWCHPCRTQHPMYDEVKERFKSRNDVVFLSIDTDEDHSVVAPFLDSQKWSRSIYFEDGLQHLLQVSEIPTTILFDKQGRVASRMNGFLPERFVDQLTERIQATLTESASGTTKPSN